MRARVPSPRTDSKHSGVVGGDPRRPKCGENPSDPCGVRSVCHHNHSVGPESVACPGVRFGSGRKRLGTQGVCIPKCARRLVCCPAAAVLTVAVGTLSLCDALGGRSGISLAQERHTTPLTHGGICVDDHGKFGIRHGTGP